MALIVECDNCGKCEHIELQGLRPPGWIMRESKASDLCPLCAEAVAAATAQALNARKQDAAQR